MKKKESHFIFLFLIKNLSINRRINIKRLIIIIGSEIKKCSTKKYK